MFRFYCVCDKFRPTTAQRCRSETEKNILQDLFSSVLSKFQNYYPSGNLKFNYLGIFQSLKLHDLMGKVLAISLKLNFTPILWAVIGLKYVSIKAAHRIHTSCRRFFTVNFPVILLFSFIFSCFKTLSYIEPVFIECPKNIRFQNMNIAYSSLFGKSCEQQTNTV